MRSPRLTKGTANVAYTDKDVLHLVNAAACAWSARRRLYVGAWQLLLGGATAILGRVGAPSVKLSRPQVSPKLPRTVELDAATVWLCLCSVAKYRYRCNVDT